MFPCRLNLVGNLLTLIMHIACILRALAKEPKGFIELDRLLGMWTHTVVTRFNGNYYLRDYILVRRSPLTSAWTWESFSLNAVCNSRSSLINGFMIWMWFIFVCWQGQLDMWGWNDQDCASPCYFDKIKFSSWVMFLEGNEKVQAGYWTVRVVILMLALINDFLNYETKPPWYWSECSVDFSTKQLKYQNFWVNSSEKMLFLQNESVVFICVFVADT